MTNLKTPPGPPAANNLLSQLQFFQHVQADMLAVLNAGFRDHGDLWMLDIGGKRNFLIKKPDHIYEITVRQADKFHKPQDYTDPLRGLARFLGNGLLTSDGAFWRKQRKLVAPAMHTQRITKYADTMVFYTVQMLEGWAGKQELDVDDAMMRATLQIVAKTLFNADVSQDAGRVSNAMAVLQEMNGNNITLESLLPTWIPTPRRRREALAVRDLDEIIYGIIRERRKSSEDTGDLLSMLLLSLDEDGQGMSDKEVRDEAVTMFLAGHETTANALNWTWVLLAQNPEVEARLHEELDRVLAGRVPSLADLRQLPYTEMVIKESMRLYPPAHGFGRVAIEDVEVDGYVIPKGSDVNIVTYAVHRDSRWWDDPEAFRPERFSPENEANIRKYSYIPFGAGPRVCIGNSFAQMEAHLMLATIAQRYQLRLAPGQVVQPNPLITLRPKGGLHMRLEARPTIQHMTPTPASAPEALPA